MGRLSGLGRWIGLAVALVAVAVLVVVIVTKPSSSPSSGASGSCPAGAPGDTDKALSVVSSWVGNTYGNTPSEEAVQPGIQGLWVAANGTAYGEEIFNEAPRELMGYRDGKTFGGYTYQHDNDIPNGGVAVTGDASYVYAAVRFGKTAGIMRYNHGLTPAPFSGGTAPSGGPSSPASGAVLVVNPSYENLTALAAANGNLYVADPQSYVSPTDTSAPEKSVIKVYRTSDLGGGVVKSFPAPRARGLAVDGDGDIWVLEQADGSNPAKIVRYSPSGTPTGQVVSGISDPTAIAIDTSGGGVGRLLVTDAGTDENVKIYTSLSTTPVMSSTLGVKGGVLAGPVPGTVGPLRFNGPNAIGVDAAGNIYVSNDGTPSFAFSNYGQGNSLEAYKPSGALLWQVYGAKYNSVASIDPSTGKDVYSAFDHYTLDLAKPAGQQWTRVGWTINPFKYPDDPRINGQGGGQLPSDPTVRVLDGHTFLFMGNGMADDLTVFRFTAHSEIAIPSGSLNAYQAKASPTTGEFIWRDTNGDGSPTGNVANEYFHPDTEANMDVTGWYVDSAGDVWQTTKTHGIREFPFGGLDKVGNPIYSYTTLRTFPTPTPFTDPRRLSYDPGTDTLILSGYTTTHPTPTFVQGDYKFAGTTLAEYQHFTKHSPSSTGAAAPTSLTASASLQPTWSDVVPYTMTASDATHKPITMTVAGNYAFVGYFTGANGLNTDTHVYNTTTGFPVGVITPGALIGGRSGNTDDEDGTTAYKTSSGQYLIFNEDDGFDKTIMYEWCRA